MIIKKYFLNKVIKKIYIQSFYIDNKLEDEFNLIFIKLDNWIEISIDEGVISILKRSNVMEMNREDIIDLFKYPVHDYSKNEIFKTFINNKIVKFNLLKYSNGKDYFGIQLKFENNSSMIFYEDLNNEKCEFSTNEGIIPDDVEIL